MLSNFYKNNKQTIIGVLIALIVFGSIKFFRHKELNDYGVVVEGKVIKVEWLHRNGACAVDVEFITNQGEKRVSHNTLYKEDNCQVGKKVNVQYSVKSDLTHVLE